jgi:hypothetical protein
MSYVLGILESIEVVEQVDEAFSRAARKALRKKRANPGSSSYTDILKQGADAYYDGKPPEANPYTGKDAEDAETWLDGYNDAKQFPR